MGGKTTSKAVLELLASVKAEVKQPEPKQEVQVQQPENGPPAWVTPELEAEIAEATTQHYNEFEDSTDDQASEREGEQRCPQQRRPHLSAWAYPTPWVSASVEPQEDFVDSSVTVTEKVTKPEPKPEPEEAKPSLGPLPTFEVEGPVPFWRQFTKALGAVNDEFPIQFEEGKLKLVAVDNAHVCMLDARVNPLYYDLNGWTSKVPAYGVRVDKIGDFLKALKAKDRLSLLYVNEGEGSLVLRSGYLERRMRPLEGESMMPPKVPNLDYEATTVVINAQKLRDILKLMGTVTDVVTFIVEPGRGFTVKAHRYDDDEPEVKAFVEKFDLLELRGKAAKAHFPLDYLDSFLKAFSKEDLEIGLPGDDFPVRIRVTFGDCEATYLLAPKIVDKD